MVIEIPLSGIPMRQKPLLLHLSLCSVYFQIQRWAGKELEEIQYQRVHEVGPPSNDPGYHCLGQTLYATQKPH